MKEEIRSKVMSGTWKEKELLDLLLSTKRLDIELTPEQLEAAKNYAITHARRFELVLNTYAHLVPPNATIFSIGSMPNHLELLFIKYFRSTVIGSTYSPQDTRDKFTAVYQYPDGQHAEMDVYLRDFGKDPIPLEDNSCDAVLCFEAVEHFLESPAPVFLEARRVLKPGGHILLSTPNLQHWYRILHGVKGLNYHDVDYTEPIESRHTHIYSVLELGALLRGARFKIIDHFFFDPWNYIKNGPQFDEADPITKGLRALLNAPEYQAEDIFISAVKPSHWWRFLDGWYEKETDGISWWRWSNGVGEIEVMSVYGGVLSLQASLYSVFKSAKLSLTLNDCVIFSTVMDGDMFREGISRKIELAPGINHLVLSSDQRPTPLENDSRLLSFAIKNLDISIISPHETLPLEVL